MNTLFRLWVVLCVAWVMLAPAAHAATKVGSPQKVAKLATKQVRQIDGQVVERIVLPPNPSPAQLADKAVVTPELWVERSLDPVWVAKLAKDPKLFAQWMDAASEPRFMTALATMAAQPATYPKAMRQLMSPAFFSNWAEVATPGVVLSWMTAGMDPRYYLGVFSRLADTRKMQRWSNCDTPGDEAGKPVASVSPSWASLPDSPKPLPWLQQPQYAARY